LRTDLIHKLEAHRLPAQLAHEFWTRAPQPSDSIVVDDLISAVLGLAYACLDPISEEPDTAFVAMPFAEPFAARYGLLYVPLLRELGYRPVRAWGGVAFEDYWDLLVMLIKKTGVLLGDLTGANPNVLHEVGLAEGLNKTALLIMERSEAEPPVNLAITGSWPTTRTMPAGLWVPWRRRPRCCGPASRDRRDVPA